MFPMIGAPLVVMKVILNIRKTHVKCTWRHIRLSHVIEWEVTLWMWCFGKWRFSYQEVAFFNPEANIRNTGYPPRTKIETRTIRACFCTIFLTTTNRIARVRRKNCHKITRGSKRGNLNIPFLHYSNLEFKFKLHGWCGRMFLSTRK